MQVSLRDNSKYTYPTFNAMKASQFKGVDYICMRKLKAPIEKFDSIRDFQKWAFDEIKTKSYNYPARTEKVELLRKDMLSKWVSSFCFDRKYPIAFLFVMLKEFCKNLKPTNDDIPPVYNPTALKNTFEEIKTKGEDVQFRFTDVYNKHLKSIFNSVKIPENGWMVIKSLTNDCQNYERNCTMLQVLSHRSWCTKSPYASTHLLYADFHLLMQEGKPQAIIRVGDDDVVEEIQSIGNLGPLPDDLPAIEKYIHENKLSLHSDVVEMIKSVKSTL